MINQKPDENVEISESIQFTVPAPNEGFVKTFETFGAAAQYVFENKERPEIVACGGCITCKTRRIVTTTHNFFFDSRNGYSK